MNHFFFAIILSCVLTLLSLEAAVGAASKLGVFDIATPKEMAQSMQEGALRLKLLPIRDYVLARQFVRVENTTNQRVRAAIECRTSGWKLLAVRSVPKQVELEPRASTRIWFPLHTINGYAVCSAAIEPPPAYRPAAPAPASKDLRADAAQRGASKAASKKRPNAGSLASPPARPTAP